MRLRLLLLSLLIMAPAQANELDDIAQLYVAEGAPGILITVHDADGTTVGRAGSIGDEHSLFRVASCSKMMTATLVLKACEEGHFKLDDTLPEEFLDELPLELPGLGEITVRELLSHRSGLPEYYDGGYVDFKRQNGGVSLSPEEALGYLEDAKLESEPGVEFSYNNTNYVLLGLLMEYVYDRSLQQVAKEKLFDPLGLENSYFTLYAESPKEVVPGYIVTSGRQRKASRLETDDGFGDGGVISTAADMTTFLEGLLEGRILGRAMLAEMTRFRKNDSGSYGLGLSKDWSGDHIAIGHEGSIPAYQSIVVHYPESKTTLVVFMNGGGDAEDVFVRLKAELDATE